MKKKPRRNKIPKTLIRPLIFVIAAFLFLSTYGHCEEAEGRRSNPIDRLLRPFGPRNDRLSQTPEYGDAFVEGHIADARTFIPILASDSASASITGLVFNGLVKYDKNLELIGDLAKSWEIKDKGLTIIFHLKKNVRWHDGHPFTARDVKFTFEKLLDPNVPTPYSGDFKMVESLEVLDDYTIKVTYIEPFSPGLASWGMPMMPEHLLKGEDLMKTPFARSPIGTGPYKFKRWISGERIDLVSNHDYFEHRPYIDRYIYRIIPDPDTTFLELQTQKVDWMPLKPLQYLRQTDTKVFKKHFRKFRYPIFSYTYMAYNLKNDLFKDKKVRQAISYAVDKNEIIEGVLLGLGKVCTGPFVPKSWAYNKNVKPFPYDAEKAKEILASCGWQDTDGDGLLDKDGKTFQFTILVNQGNEERKKASEIIQRRLKEIGIKVDIWVLEWAVFLNKFVDEKNFDCMILGWGLGLDPDNFDIWHSSKTKKGEFNFISYSSPEVDSLLVEGRRTFSTRKRAGIYRRIHEIIYDDQPYLFLYVPDALLAVHNRFRGIELAPIGVTYNFIDWWVPEQEQRYTHIKAHD